MARRRSTRTSRSVAAIRQERMKQGHERAHRRWTQGEEGTLTREFHAGKTVEEMARAHQRTMVAIENRLTRLQLYGAKRTRNEGGPAPDMTVVPPKLPNGSPVRSVDQPRPEGQQEKKSIFGFLRRRLS